jgi:hypothetical protein
VHALPSLDQDHKSKYEALLHRHHDTNDESKYEALLHRHHDTNDEHRQVRDIQDMHTKWWWSLSSSDV